MGYTIGAAHDLSVANNRATSPSVGKGYRM